MALILQDNNIFLTDYITKIQNLLEYDKISTSQSSKNAPIECYIGGYTLQCDLPHNNNNLNHISSNDLSNIIYETLSNNDEQQINNAMKQYFLAIINALHYELYYEHKDQEHHNMLDHTEETEEYEFDL